MKDKKNYWDGKVALICSYCLYYVSFPTIEELKAHIETDHKFQSK